MDRRQRIDVIPVTDCFADGDVRNTGNDGDVTAVSFVNRLSLNALVDKQLGDGAPIRR